MRLMICRPLLVALILNAVSAAAALHDCAIPGVKGPVQCGQVDVPENWNQRGGRLIPLKVVKLQAEMQPKRPDPLYVLQGGPAQPVTQLAGYYGRVFSGIRRFRDIVLVNMRGTEQANGLYCDIYANSPTRIDHLFSPEAIRKCREMLASRADVDQYRHLCSGHH